MIDLEVEKVEGTGTPVVFIHGWMGSKESWKQVRENLELDNPMIFYSQRCHGRSECSGFSIEDLAHDLEQITEELDDPILVGHSMGGMTALTYSTVSENFSGMLLLATCASTPEPKYRSPSFFLEKLGDMARQKWAEMITDNYAENADPEIREFSISELIQADRKPLVKGLKAMIDYDVRERLQDENALVVAGRNDNTIPKKQAEEVAELLNCEYREIDATHLMLQETPGKIAEITEEFTETQ